MENFDKAVARAKAYTAAGADMIFPEALGNKAEFADFARKVKTPLLANMTEFGVSPLLSSKELFQMGYKVVIYPMGAFRTMMKATEGFYNTMHKEGTQAGMLDKMQTRKELYELLDYDSYAKLDEKAYGGFRK